jgi:hypothetical protein
MRAQAFIRSEALRHAISSYIQAEKQIDIMIGLQVQWDAGRISTMTYIRESLVKIELTCGYINLASHENIHVESIFNNLQRHVEILNRVIRRHTYLHMDVVIVHGVTGIFAEFERQELQEDQEDQELQEDQEIQEIQEDQKKKTSDYLKEDVYIVQDLTDSECDLSRECTICFDHLTSVNSILTNCKHAYCEQCIKDLATSIKDKTEKPLCPMCRQEITELTTKTPAICNEINNHIFNL